MSSILQFDLAAIQIHNLFGMALLIVACKCAAMDVYLPIVWCNLLPKIENVLPLKENVWPLLQQEMNVRMQSRNIQ